MKSNTSRTKTNIKAKLNSFLTRSTGLQIVRANKTARYPMGLLYEADNDFNVLYQSASKQTQTPGDSQKRRARFYDLMQFFGSTQHLSGAMAECGCWKGLSSLMMCRLLRNNDSSFQGNDYYIFDSFEGLSKPTDEDEITDKDVILRHVITHLHGRHFAASLENVQHALHEFPRIEYLKGWLPQTLQGQPERLYRFVHVDVDVYEPTRGCIEYFFPRLVDGGILVCDDYGSLNWPGAKKAVDDYCALHGIRFVSLSSGSAIMFKDK